MTTISPKRRRTAARAQLVSVVVLVIAIAGVAALVREPLSSMFWRVGVPLSHVRDSVAHTFGNVFTSFGSSYALVAENNRLRAALASTTVLLLDRDVLYTENTDLKSRLGRPSFDTPALLATVVSLPPASPYDTLMIDVGRKDGVVVGDIVAAGGSVYVGKIDQVYATASRVVLFSAPGSNYTAQLIDAAATTSLAIAIAGQGGGSLTSEIPAGSPVHMGDKIVFKNIAAQLVAEVVGIDEKNQASFKTIYLRLPVNIYSIRFVEVHHKND